MQVGFEVVLHGRRRGILEAHLVVAGPWRARMSAWSDDAPCSRKPALRPLAP